LPDGRWRPLEIVFWLISVAGFFVFADYRILGSQILITGLFALSLDLILGYAGIASLGHAAFFGIGAYTAGLLAKNGLDDPMFGLLVAAALAALVGYLVSFLVVRGSDLTRLMVTLGVGLMLWEVANKAAFITGGVDGLVHRRQSARPLVVRHSRPPLFYALAVVFVVFLLMRRLVNSPFGLSCVAFVRRQAHAGDRRTGWQRLRAIFTVAAAVAGIAGALLARPRIRVYRFARLSTLGRTAVMLVAGRRGPAMAVSSAPRYS
jgi:branched-chain amino acid transport system permease protein